MKPAEVVCQSWVDWLLLLEDNMLGVHVRQVCLKHHHGSPPASKIDLVVHLGLVHDVLELLSASQDLVVAVSRHVNSQLVEVSIFNEFFLVQIRSHLS